jgi:hypothetical protein
LLARPGMDENEQSEPEELEVTWDQPQPRYPAPERPRDSAEERPDEPAEQPPARRPAPRPQKRRERQKRSV